MQASLAELFFCCQSMTKVPTAGKRQRHIGLAQSDVLECRQLLTAYTFSAIPFDATDGANPQSGVVADAQGDLFGTASNGGAGGDGTVFEIAHGTETISVVASFDDTDGKSPQTPVPLDANGDIFGTTVLGGANGDGSVFEIVHGTNTITTLASFDGTDGIQPQGGVILDANGDLFGTAGDGPSTSGCCYHGNRGRAERSRFANLSAHANQVCRAGAKRPRGNRRRHLRDHPGCESKQQHRHQGWEDLSNGLIGGVAIHRRDPVVRDRLEYTQHEVNQHQADAGTYS